MSGGESGGVGVVVGGGVAGREELRRTAWAEGSRKGARKSEGLTEERKGLDFACNGVRICAVEGACADAEL